MKARTIAALLRSRAERSGEAPGLFHKSGGAWVGWSWGRYWENATRAAAGLRASGVRPGDHVLLLVVDVDVAVANLFGVWALGAVPIQVGLPFRLGDVAAFLGQLQDTARRLSVRAIVVSEALLARAQDPEPVVRVLSAEAMLLADGAGPTADPDPTTAPALLQLTSGSTGHPRAVVISHRGLLDHLAAMTAALPIGGDGAAGVSWLPLHHDMGLIGGLLFPLFNGFPVHCLSPLDFRRNPFVWLSEMSRIRGTCSLGPPSAYAICLRLARRAVESGLDLSSWQCAMIGAEPISADLLRRFAESFRPCGFRPEAFFPVYGLAEATVAVSFPRLLDRTCVDRVDRSVLEREGRAVPADGGPTTVELVGVGRAIPGTEIRIVGADGVMLGPRQVGEVWVRSGTLMQGYYGDAEGTAAVMTDGWLRTGDLGYQVDGTLFITGRMKDVIIKGGHNLLPSAIEEVAEGVDGVRHGGAAAVGIRSPEQHTELVYVVAETKVAPPDRPVLAERIRDALKVRGMAADHVLLVGRASLPRTTSGKIKRGEVARAITAGDL